MNFRLMKSLIPVLPALFLCACAALPGAGFLSSGQQSKPVGGGSTSPTASATPIRLTSRHYVLANGLRLVVHADPHASAVALAMWYHVGSKDEPPGEHGLARLFGHAMLDAFQSSIGIGIQPLEVAGATHVGVRVTRDATEFHETLPRPALDLGLWIEAQRMRHHAEDINGMVLQAARQAMLHALVQQDRQPYGRVPAIIARMTYPAGHPYSWTPDGSAAGLSDVTVDDARSWMDRYFNPANATLVVAGNVRPSAIKALADRYFDGLSNGQRVGHLTRWVARMHGERRRTMVEAVPRPRLYMVWNVPPAFTSDVARLQLAAAVLGSGNDSLLFRQLVRKDRLATHVSAIVEQHEAGSQFVITVDLKPGVSAARVERDADKTLANLLADGPSSHALRRARTTVLARVVRQLQSLSGQARWLARSQVFTGSPDAWKHQIKVIRSADGQAVRDAAADWLSGGVFSLYVVPKSSGSKQDASNAPGQPPPSVGPPEQMHVPRLRAVALSNGMVVLLARRDTAPLVDFDLIIGGGLTSDTGITNGTARLAFKLLGDASASKDSTDNQKLDDLGARLNARVDLDAADLHMSALHLHLRKSLKVFAQLVKHPAFPAAAVAQGKEQLLAAIATQRDSLAGIFHRVLTPILFGPSHPYAHAGLGEADLIRSIDRQDLVAYARRWIRPDNATLLVTGDIDLPRLESLIRSDFGNWHASPIPLTQVQIPNVSPPEAQQVDLVNLDRAAQGLIVAARLLPPPTEIDEPALRVAKAALCAHLAVALGMKKITLTTQDSGVFCGLLPAQSQQVFYVGVRVPTNKTATVTQALGKQLDMSIPLSAKSIDLAKQAMALRLPAQLQTSGGLSASYVRMLMLGLPQDSIHHPVWTIESLQPEQVEQAANQFLRPAAALTWIVIGDKAKIQPSLQAIHFGAIQLVNRDGRPVESGS